MIENSDLTCQGRNILMVRQDIYNILHDEEIEKMSKGEVKDSQHQVEEVPHSYCCAYHLEGQFCDKNKDCKYKHGCYMCNNGYHPLFLCREKSGRKSTYRIKPKPNSQGDRSNSATAGKSPNPDKAK